MAAADVALGALEADAADAAVPPQELAARLTEEAAADAGCLDAAALESSLSVSGLADADPAAKVSLWDLRLELKASLAAGGAEAAADDGVVALPRIAVAHLLDVLREHVRHRQVERALRKDVKVRKHSATVEAAHAIAPRVRLL